MAKFILTSYLLWLSFKAFSQTGTVILNVQGIRSEKGGELSAGLFKEPNFPKVGKQFIGTEKPITASQMQLVFSNVPEGAYGIVVFQDIDRNKDLKTNFVGFPIEPIGFSNDVRIKLGPPAFTDAKIMVVSNQTITLPIILR